MTDLRILHPNIEWEGRQTCTMNSEELLAIRKLRETRDYHSSRSGSLYRCTVREYIIDIWRILVSGQEGNNTFYLHMLYDLEHAMAFHALHTGTWQVKLAIIDAQLLYRDGPAGVLT